MFCINKNINKNKECSLNIFTDCFLGKHTLLIIPILLSAKHFALNMNFRNQSM